MSINTTDHMVRLSTIHTLAAAYKQGAVHAAPNAQWADKVWPFADRLVFHQG
ncbi:hypothetical protein ACQY0O_001971 [Thecaphora frezii]